jgi:hypothetical protein
MIDRDVIEDIKSVRLSVSNRYIIGQALRAYKNLALFSTESDEYIEIQDVEIDEILEEIGE